MSRTSSSYRKTSRIIVTKKRYANSQQTVNQQSWLFHRLPGGSARGNIFVPNLSKPCPSTSKETANHSTAVYFHPCLLAVPAAR